MDLALNSLKRLICHKTQKIKQYHLLLQLKFLKRVVLD